MNNALIVLPTYNEMANIEKLICEIKSIINEIEILIIDDSSPDGTADVVVDLMQTVPGLHLIRRKKKGGLGTAYVEGFKFAIERGVEYVITMDADFSHDPKYLRALLDSDRKYDVVIASRYIQNRGVVSWPFTRLLLSIIGNKYIRLITGLPIKDCTSGFKRYRVEVLKCIEFSEIKANHFAFQVEIIFKLFKKGFTLTEVPFVFVGRSKGRSKISKNVLFEAMWIPWKLAFSCISDKGNYDIQKKWPLRRRGHKG